MRVNVMYVPPGRCGKVCQEPCEIAGAEKQEWKLILINEDVDDVSQESDCACVSSTDDSVDADAWLQVE